MDGHGYTVEYVTTGDYCNTRTGIFSIDSQKLLTLVLVTANGEPLARSISSRETCDYMDITSLRFSKNRPLIKIKI